MRVPCIVRWPGKIAANDTCDEIAITMDILPTLARLVNLDIPKDRIIDGKDIWPLLSRDEEVSSPHEAFYFYQMDQLQAIRSGKWKLHLPLENKRRNWGEGLGKVELKLFDLESDIQEQSNLSLQHPEVVNRLLNLAEKAREDLGDSDRNGKQQRNAGTVINPRPLIFQKSQ